MVHGFVKQSGGHVRIYSEIGEGTVVKLYLPRLMQTITAARSAPLASDVPQLALRRARAGETILLVEDDEGVRDYSTDALEDLGYRVLATASGDDALRLLANNERIDLLFTDVMLGGTMNGRQLADAVRRLQPSMPVLYTTGYTRNAIVHEGRVDAGVHLLNKPFTQRDLAEKIRKILT
jgi:CheY-like chemotaxis protein